MEGPGWENALIAAVILTDPAPDDQSLPPARPALQVSRRPNT